MMRLAKQRRSLSAAFVAALCLATAPAFAACSTPLGNPGDVVYSSISSTMAYCNGTFWIAMGSNSAVSYGTLTTNDFCVATGGTAITCTTVPTGTGNVVMSSSPTLTGTVAGANSTWTGQVAVGTTTLSGALNIVGTATATTFSGAYTGSGSGLTGIGTSSLGGISGTPSATTYLRGDGTWGTVATGLTVASTAIAIGSTTRVLYDNAGTLGEYTITGTGNVVMSASPTLTGTITGVAANFSGNVGIGTAAPTKQLQIVNSAGNLLRLSYDGAGTADWDITRNLTTGSLSIQGSQSGFNNIALAPTSGNVGIGTPSPGATLHVNGGGMFAPTTSPITNGGLQIDGGANGRIYIARTNADTVEEFYYVGSGRVGSISISSSATTYATASDRRLKENFADSKLGLGALMNIPVQDFNFIADKDKTRVQGFIAQDLYKVYPEAVGVGGDDPKTKPWSVDYGRLTPLLVKSIQELKADNDDLHASNDNEAAQIKTLTARLDALEAKRH